MGKHVHKLSDVDPDARTGVCAACGPVGVQRTSKGYFRCARKSEAVTPGAPRAKRRGPSHKLSNILYRQRLADCSECGPGAEVGAKADRHSPSGISWYCLTPKRMRPDPAHGLNYYERLALIKASGEKCAICHTTEPGGNTGWQVDHCHTTGTIRGVLCTRCNLGLGYFGDDSQRLIAAASYLFAIQAAQHLHGLNR